MKDNDDEKKNAYIYKDSISKLSNEILDGTHGIFFFQWCIFINIFGLLFF